MVKWNLKILRFIIHANKVNPLSNTRKKEEKRIKGFTNKK